MSDASPKPLIDGVHAPEVDQERLAAAETKEAAERAMDNFKEKYAAKYPKAWERLEKDRDVLLAFYDFPAEHWRHIRTTNPVESAFATIRLRHRRTKGSDCSALIETGLASQV